MDNLEIQSKEVPRLKYSEKYSKKYNKNKIFGWEFIKIQGHIDSTCAILGRNL